MYFHAISTISQDVLRELPGGDRTMTLIRSASTKEHP